MAHLVVARLEESLDWIQDLPTHCSLTVYNAGPAIDIGAFDHDIQVHAVPTGTPAMACHLAFLRSGVRSLQDELVVFCPGAPLAHAPAFMELLDQSERFGELQVLSLRSSHAQLPPQNLLDTDRRDWVGAYPVRAERYSLRSLAPLAYQHDMALHTGKTYRRKHRLAEGSHLMAHFFERAGLPALAAEALQADVGIYAHAGMVALRKNRLIKTLAQLGPQLERLALLLEADCNYPEMLERAWLHLLGLPFIRLEALAQPAAQNPQVAAPGIARVVASIDAVLAQSRPGLRQVPTLAPETAVTPPVGAPRVQPERTTPAVATANDWRQMRERAHAAQQRGDMGLAWEWLQKALAQAPRNIELLADATHLAYAQQDTERALHCARRALAVEPEHLECLFTLGMCLAATGQAEEALGIFDKLNQAPLAEQWQAQHPELAAVDNVRGELLEQTRIRRSIAV